MREFLFAVVLLFSVFSAQGQNKLDLYEEPVVLYTKQVYGGFTIHSSGIGGHFTKARYLDATRLRLISFDLLTMKHEKEIKSFNPVYEDSRSYVLGKVNNMYVLRPGIGRKKILTSKLRQHGVQVALIYMVGPSLGITKPVYLEIGYPSIPYEYISVEKYDPSKHDFYNIYGRASGLNGLNELTLYPGAFFKFAVNFEYSNYKEGLKGMELGVSVDAYLKQVPIMAPEFIKDNRQIFPVLYLNVFFGKKYNR